LRFWLKPQAINLNGELMTTTKTKKKTTGKKTEELSARLRKEYDDEVKKIAERTKRKDASMKKKGYEYRLAAWIHPKSGGDDYKLTVYCPTKATKAEIKGILKEHNSACYDDYKLIKL